MEYNPAKPILPQPSTIYFHVVTNSLGLSLVLESYYLLALAREPKKDKACASIFPTGLKALISIDPYILLVLQI